MATIRSMAALAVVLGGCGPEPRAYDEFPLSVDLSSGPLMSQVGVNGDAPVPMVIDTLSPVTIFDPVEDAPATQRSLELTLYSVSEDGQPTVARAKAPKTPAFVFRPCPADCAVGTADALRPIGGVVGSDALSRSAVRIDFTNGLMSFRPDISGKNSVRTDACEAIFNTPFAGGGTLTVGDAVIPHRGLRPAMRSCIAASPRETISDDGSTGTDLLLVISTAIGPNILSASSYDRYVTKHGGPRLDELPIGSITIPAQRLDGRIATIENLALMGGARGEFGGCGELYASRIMVAGGCAAAGIGSCPCPDNTSFCRTNAAIELNSAHTYLVIDDTAPLLQALREELRPAYPEVDGILGADALGPLAVDLDYPNSRILMTCVREPCLARPNITSASTYQKAQCETPDTPFELDGGIQ